MGSVKYRGSKRNYRNEHHVLVPGNDPRGICSLESGDVSVADAVAALSDFIDEDISLGNTYQKFFCVPGAARMGR